MSKKDREQKPTEIVEANRVLYERVQELERENKRLTQEVETERRMKELYQGELKLRDKELELHKLKEQSKPPAGLTFGSWGKKTG